MYRIYQTESLVIEGKPLGEADKMISLLTRDFGMIYAHARGIRKVQSKLRFALQEMSFAEVALVRGKDLWRITSALLANVVSEKRKQAAQAFVFPSFVSQAKEHLLPASSLHYMTLDEKERHLIARRVIKLLKRLLPGEEGNSALFDTIKDGFSFLTLIDEKDVKNFEAIFVLRILHHLGYIGDSATLSSFVLSREFTPELVQAMDPLRREAVLHINRSLQASNL